MSIILILSIIAAFFYHPKAITANNGQYSVIPLSSSSAGTSAGEAQAPAQEDSPPAMQLAPSKWSDPWLNGFPYRKPISIAGSTSTLTQFQVNVTPYIYNETGLVGSWHFSESSGNATADSSGQGNTGYQYGTSRTTGGKFGNAIKFDGVDDYVDAGSASSLNMGTNDFTIEAWVKTSNTPAGSRIVTKRDGGTNWYSLMTNPNTISLELQGNAYAHSTQNIVDGNWHHVVAIRNYAGATGKIYVDGIDVTSGTPTGLGLNVDNTASVQIGKWSTDLALFNGTIDEVRIYNRALSATEIQQQYQASKARLDYQDVRFTDSDGATLLPFWMESDGKFWVKVPSIPTTGTTIYAYYGNPQATDVQNASGTFEFFDDFSGSLSKWTTTADVSIVDGRINVNSQSTLNRYAKTPYFSKPIILEAKYIPKVKATQTMRIEYSTGFGLGATDGVWFSDDGAISTWNLANAAGTSPSTSTAINTVVNSEYKVKLIVKDNPVLYY